MHSILTTISTEETDASSLQFDLDGYLINKYDWNETLARKLAKNEGIAHLGNEHWQVIHYIRDYFDRLNAMPPPRRVCRQLGIEGHDIKAMFGSCLAVWRIAGLPNPGDEARAHIH